MIFNDIFLHYLCTFRIRFARLKLSLYFLSFRIQCITFEYSKNKNISLLFIFQVFFFTSPSFKLYNFKIILTCKWYSEIKTLRIPGTHDTYLSDFIEKNHTLHIIFYSVLTGLNNMYTNNRWAVSVLVRHTRGI